MPKGRFLSITCQRDLREFVQSDPPKLRLGRCHMFNGHLFTAEVDLKRFTNLYFFEIVGSYKHSLAWIDNHSSKWERKYGEETKEDVLKRSIWNVFNRVAPLYDSQLQDACVRFYEENKAKEKDNAFG